MRRVPPRGRIAAKTIKGAFFLSVALYVPVLLELSHLPSWSAPWLPLDLTKRVFLAASAAAALTGWLVGVMLGRGHFSWSGGILNGSGARGSIHVFVVSAALIESGALLGLASSLLLNDARYGLLAVTATLILLALHPIGARESRKDPG
ncbi:MAG: hypothetical protein P8018_12385 [Acidobacteriota bacterium]